MARCTDVQICWSCYSVQLTRLYIGLANHRCQLVYLHFNYNSLAIRFVELHFVMIDLTTFGGSVRASHAEKLLICDLAIPVSESTIRSIISLTISQLPVCFNSAWDLRFHTLHIASLICRSSTSNVTVIIGYLWVTSCMLLTETTTLQRRFRNGRFAHPLPKAFCAV